MEEYQGRCRDFFEQVVYAAGVGHCIRFWYDCWNGHTSFSKGSIKEIFGEVKKMLGSHQDFKV